MSPISGKGGFKIGGAVRVSGQFSVTFNGTRLTSERTTSWTNTLVHEFTATFTSAGAASDFFSNGGEIRTSGQRSGGSNNSQNDDWTNLLIGMGTIIFNNTSTAATGDGTGSAIGFDNLTGSYQQIYNVLGEGAYVSDEYKLEARADSTTVVRFKATFTDALDNVVDQAVDGTINHFVDDKRNVSQPAPTYASLVDLTAGS